MINIQSLVKAVRQFRSLHRYIGVGISALILITSVTGVFLGWKKNSDTLQPPTMEGASADMHQWKSFAEISKAALSGMDSTGNPGNEIDRMDVRPEKGIIKVQFKKGYWEAQIDGQTGKVLSVAQRHSDWIERIHDGSIVNDVFKLAYTNILGIGLFVLAASGLWLWYGPKVIRRSK